ncbi:MAG TPA: leucine-rich repeat domain-containing protein [Cytophaga sp.]|nr:leucine-rich repeat domain-containing protein [Cytophaga sp.]
MKQLTSILKHVHYKVAGIILLVIAVSIQTVAQTTVAIPDVNFRNKLLSSYPSVMTGNQLNIAAAQSYTFDVILSGSNISDLTGIEYFTSTFKIDVSYNNVTSIPAISSSSPIKYLYANNNQLTQLPNLSALTGLLELQVSYNKLTSLPQLNTLTSLTNLLASDNSLTSLPSITNLTNLKYLIIGNNPFTSLPDFSPNSNLLELHVHQTGTSEIKGLASLTKLKKLYCWQNSISDLSALSANTTLNGLYAFQNNLSALPTLTNKPLMFVEIANNQLTFEDLLPLSTLTLFDFSYSPQDSMGVYTSLPTRLLHTLSLGMTEDAGVTNSIYTWYKNAASIGTTTVNQNTIATAAQTTDAGTYYVSITNSSLPALTLTHRLWNVSIINCVDLLSYSFSIASNECSSGATINSTVVLDGGTAPYQYVLTPLNSPAAISSSNGDFSQIAPGQYAYSIKDANGCGIDTTAVVQKPAKCDPVITPNGDAQMSSYFIEQTGTAKIIDIEGKTILQLTTPAVWYGTKNDGTFADAGYYVIVVNNKKVTNITVIR